MTERYIDGGMNFPIRSFSKATRDTAMAVARKALQEIAALGREAHADGSPAIRMGRIAEVALATLSPVETETSGQEG